MSDQILPSDIGMTLWGDWVGPAELSGPPRLPHNVPDDPRAQQAAKDFESILVHQLLESMRKTIPNGGLFQSATGRQVEGIFWYYLAGAVARRGGLGLWREVYRQFAADVQDHRTGGDRELTQ